MVIKGKEGFLAGALVFLSVDSDAKNESVNKGSRDLPRGIAWTCFARTSSRL